MGSIRVRGRHWVYAELGYSTPVARRCKSRIERFKGLRSRVIEVHLKSHPFMRLIIHYKEHTTETLLNKIREIHIMNIMILKIWYSIMILKITTIVTIRVNFYKVISVSFRLIENNDHSHPGLKLRSVERDLGIVKG